MEKIIDRSEITEELYFDILNTESHHDHQIILDESGVYRWKANPIIEFCLKKTSLNDLIIHLINLGHDKNSEIYRKLYRDMGYSLHGYWEIFYWEFNNEGSNEYIPGLK